MSEWHVGLQGSENDIESMRHYLPAGCKMSRIHGRSTICLPAGTEMSDADAILDSGRLTVETAINFALVGDSLNLVVDCDRAFRVDEQGNVKSYASADVSSAAVISVEGYSLGAEVSMQRRNAIEEAHSDVDRQDAMRFWREGTWGSLYKALEIIESRVHRKQIVANQWASKREIRRFEHTANTEAGAGGDARHARDNNPPPPIPMSLRDASDLVGAILKAWLSQREP